MIKRNRWEIRLDRETGNYRLGWFSNLTDGNSIWIATNWNPPQWVIEKMALIDLYQGDINACIDIGWYRFTASEMNGNSGDYPVWYSS